MAEAVVVVAVIEVVAEEGALAALPGIDPALPLLEAEIEIAMGGITHVTMVQLPQTSSNFADCHLAQALAKFLTSLMTLR